VIAAVILGFIGLVCVIYAGYLGGELVFTKGTALPHQESDFGFFTKHPLYEESFCHFQPNHHFTNFPSPKRPGA
jgi:hypothetical protein